MRWEHAVGKVMSKGPLVRQIIFNTAVIIFEKSSQTANLIVLHLIIQALKGIGLTSSARYAQELPEM